MTQLRNKMLEEIQRRNYSHRTARTYVRIVRDFAEYFHQPPDKLGPEQIRQYQAHLFQTKKLAPATVSQYVSDAWNARLLLFACSWASSDSVSFRPLKEADFLFWR